MRQPIRKITDKTVRQDRYNYFKNCDCLKDETCKKNCLDVCVDYNNKFERFKIEQQTKISKLDGSLFTYDRWIASSIHAFEIKHLRYGNIEEYKEKLLVNLEGYCFAENLICKPKENHVALLYKIGDDYMWFHIRNNEFIKLIE